MQLYPLERFSDCMHDLPSVNVFFLFPNVVNQPVTAEFLRRSVTFYLIRRLYK